MRRYMFKKRIGYFMVWLIMLAGMLLLCFRQREEYFKTCFPAFFYRIVSEKKDIYGEACLRRIFPGLIWSDNLQIKISRKDFFLLDKIKPVEILTMMEVENLKEQADKQTQELLTETEPVTDIEMSVVQEETAMENSVQETSGEMMQVSFVPHTLQNIIDIGELSDYQTMIKEFYVVDSVAMVKEELLNAQALDSKELRISKNSQGPQILIYHTHSQEGFADSVKGDENTTIMGVGAHLAKILSEQYGYEVLHHRGKYDVETRDNAYSRALPEIKAILEENPSIQVVIDLHRDAVADENNKLVMDLDGRPTARFMFFNGVSCGKKTGDIDYLYNPYLEENMAFSFQLKKVSEEYYPGLTRKNYINAYRYNMHLCGRTTLLELGAQNNTLEEAKNACDPIAHILDMVLSGA